MNFYMIMAFLTFFFFIDNKKDKKYILSKKK